MKSIRWVRVLIAGVVAELALFAVVPLNFFPWGPAVLNAIVIPVCVLAAFLGGWWAARKAARLHWLHGLLVGALAAAIYLALTVTQELPLTYTIANALKLAGGAAGGVFAAWRQRGAAA